MGLGRERARGGGWRGGVARWPGSDHVLADAEEGECSIGGEQWIAQENKEDVNRGHKSRPAIETLVREDEPV